MATILPYSTALVGHHLLTMRLLEAGLLAKNARIVIAGSEAARGNVLGMTLPDYHRLAATEFNGDLQAMIVSFLHGEAPVRHKWSNSYATGKMMVAWWAAALSRVLPAGHNRQCSLARRHAGNQLCPGRWFPNADDDVCDDVGRTCHWNDAHRPSGRAPLCRCGLV